MMTVFGIKNCDTVKKATAWLEQNNIAYTFRDVRQHPVDVDTVLAWLQQVPAEKLVNKRSTTWRQLTDEQRQLNSDDAAAQLMVDNPTLFKRPLVEDTQGIHVGFKADDWQTRYQ